MTTNEINEVGFYLQDKYGVAGSFIPEPSSFVLDVLGLLSLGFFGWRRRRMRR